ncbi:EAL domain-containing protein [Azospirillum sp. TSO22-1]|uniref:EAL domain-containing protein n=1 Tax=Azospirillum sp. TSO22-1 TaxID=716789 RepID=UPI000D6442F6|nr:EAL domain-containing protein [Azospirillum sp. TSO22-1]
MTLLTHIVYALAYIVAGVSVGAVLPFLRPETDPLVAWMAGGMVVLAGVLVHEVITRFDRERTLNKRFTRMLEAMGTLNEELTRQHAEMDTIRTDMERVRQLGGVAGYDTVMQEVKLLQSLVGRLQEKRPPPRPPVPPATAGAPPKARPTVESGGAVLPQAPQVAAVPPSSGDLDDARVLETVRDALRADRIDIYLQPIVSLPQRRHRFYEVFSRVRASDGATIKPDRYLAIAEREGLIATIDNLLLVRCIQLIRETERRQHQIGFFSNISPATIGDAEFMKQFLEFMAQNQTLVPKLVFELGQDDMRAGQAVTQAILSQLARLGFRFSMDQVGDVAAVDVDALARNDFRYLKLDCARLLAPDARARAPGLLKRCKEHEIDVIVEKIETENQLIELLDLGVDFGQGYLFGEPRLSRKPG